MVRDEEEMEVSLISHQKQPTGTIISQQIINPDNWQRMGLELHERLNKITNSGWYIVLIVLL